MTSMVLHGLSHSMSPSLSPVTTSSHAFAKVPFCCRVFPHVVSFAWNMLSCSPHILICSHTSSLRPFVIFCLCFSEQVLQYKVKFCRQVHYVFLPPLLGCKDRATSAIHACICCMYRIKYIIDHIKCFMH